MTAEELANLGYQSGQQPTLFVPADEPQAPQIDPAVLNQFQAAPSPSPQPVMDQTTLNAVAVGSDPNHLISGPQMVQGPDGSPIPVPNNSDAANLNAAQAESIPQLDPASGSQASQAQAAPAAQPAQPDARPAPPQNPNLAVSKGFPTYNEWAIASGLPPTGTREERKQAQQAYFEQQKAFMDVQFKQGDPEYQAGLKLKQADLADRPIKNQNMQAQTAESQSKVVAAELAKGKALEDATQQINALKDQRDLVLSVANDPQLPSVTGLIGSKLPLLTKEQRDLGSRLEQLGGQQLLAGINKIKDEAATPGSALGFRITQQEAMAVKNAVSRLQRYQDPETFRNSANEYVGVINRAIDAKQKQLNTMPGVNTDLLKQLNYAPASAGNASAGSAATGTSSAAQGAPQIRTYKGQRMSKGPDGLWYPAP